MSEDSKKFENDPRILCKYGLKCYQKNPEHIKKFKHPPLNMKRKKEINKGTDDKRFKNEETKNSATSSSKTAVVELKDDYKARNEIVLPEDVEFYENSKHETLKELFLVNMPPDFFKFYECLCEESADIEKLLSSVNLELIGPYDFLLGKLPVLEDKELYLVHWRFFFDVPEFQTVIKRKGQSQYHIGYFRDTPEDPPVFVASNDSSVDCMLTPMAYNIFGAVFLYLQNEKKKSPFIAMACQKLMDKVKKWAEKHQFSLGEFEKRKRNTISVAPTLHGAGIVVPYDKKTELGYRPLVMNNKKLAHMFKEIEVSAGDQTKKNTLLSELQPVITFANIAVDECDFGTGLEAGIDLFSSGLKDLELTAQGILSSTYTLLKREAFAKIIQAHIKYRRKGPCMSLISKTTKETVK